MDRTTDRRHADGDDPSPRHLVPVPLPSTELDGGPGPSSPDLTESGETLACETTTAIVSAEPVTSVRSSLRTPR